MTSLGPSESLTSDIGSFPHTVFRCKPGELNKLGLCSMEKFVVGVFRAKSLPCCPCFDYVISSKPSACVSLLLKDRPPAPAFPFAQGASSPFLEASFSVPSSVLLFYTGIPQVLGVAQFLVVSARCQALLGEITLPGPPCLRAPA